MTRGGGASAPLRRGARSRFMGTRRAPRARATSAPHERHERGPRAPRTSATSEGHECPARAPRARATSAPHERHERGPPFTLSPVLSPAPQPRNPQVIHKAIHNPRQRFSTEQVFDATNKCSIERSNKCSIFSAVLFPQANLKRSPPPSAGFEKKLYYVKILRRFLDRWRQKGHFGSLLAI